MQVILERNSWYGAVCAPVGTWSWSASPVRLLAIEPLKTGQSLLRLRMVAVFQPRGPLIADATFRVLKRTADHVVLQAVEGMERDLTLIIELMSDAWLAQYWPEMLERTFYGDPYDIEGPTDLLTLAYFSNEAVIEHGVLPTSFSVDPHAMPATSQTLEYQRRFDRLDSCLLRRGVLPKQMEDKWFVYVESGMLVFKRSWTGYVVYTVDLLSTGDVLEARSVTVNRDPEQYKSASDVDDLRQLDELIDYLLLGKTDHG